MLATLALAVLMALASACPSPLVTPQENAGVEQEERPASPEIEQQGQQATPEGEEPLAFECIGGGEGETLTCVTAAQAEAGGGDVTVKVPWQGKQVQVQGLQLPPGSCPFTNTNLSKLVVVFDVVEDAEPAQVTPIASFTPTIKLEIEIPPEAWPGSQAVARQADGSGAESKGEDQEGPSGEAVIEPILGYCVPGSANEKWTLFTPEDHNYQFEGNPQQGGILSVEIAEWTDPAIASGP